MRINVGITSLVFDRSIESKTTFITSSFWSNLTLVILPWLNIVDRSVQNRLTLTSLLEFGIVDSRLMSSFDFYRRNHASFFSQKREFHSLRHSPWPTHWLVFANCSIQTNRPDTKQKTSIFDPFFIPFILESLEFVFVASSSISSLLGFNVLLHVLLQC